MRKSDESECSIIIRSSDSTYTGVRAPVITRPGTRRGNILLRLTIDVAPDTADALSGVDVNKLVCLDVDEDLRRGLRKSSQLSCREGGEKEIGAGVDDERDLRGGRC